MLCNCIPVKNFKEYFLVYQKVFSRVTDKEIMAIIFTQRRK
jgi:hypothetical protein